MCVCARVTIDNRYTGGTRGRPLHGASGRRPIHGASGRRPIHGASGRRPTLDIVGWDHGKHAQIQYA